MNCTFVTRLARPKFDRRAVVLGSITALFLALGLHKHISAQLTLTGDEPRYLLYGLSIITEGRTVMDSGHYEQLRERQTKEGGAAQYAFADLQGANRVPSHSIALSLLLAPFCASWSVAHIRLVCLSIGLVGLVFLARTFIQLTSGVILAATCFLPAVFLFPALPYYFLALPEIVLFTLVAITFWNIVSIHEGGLRGYWPALTCSCLAPFFHLRGLALFVAVALYLLARLLRKRGQKSRWRGITITGATYSAALSLLLVFNWCIHGHILGSANTARPSWQTEVVVAMFFGPRHGLFTYSPVWLLSFSGLLAGLSRRNRWAVPSAVFLLLVILASTGPYPGECYPARFWVQAVPVLSICLLGFLQGPHSFGAKAFLYAALMCISLANTLLFFSIPGLHLEARNGTYPYDRLFTLARSMHFGFWLDAAYDPVIRTAIVAYCCTAVVVAAAVSVVRSRLVAACAIVMLLVAFELHRAHVLDSTVTQDGSALIARVHAAGGKAGRRVRLQALAPWRADVGGRIADIEDGITRSQRPLPSAAVYYRTSAASKTSLDVRIDWDVNHDGAKPTDPAASPAEFRAIISKSRLSRLF